jgi:phosphoglycerate dehydrogenase-like enzyme
MSELRAASPASHVLYLHRRHIIDLHRESVQSFFSTRLPGVRVSFADGPSDKLSEDTDCLIAPADAWIASVVTVLPALHWVHFMGSGTDLVREFVSDRQDLIFSNSPTATAVAMAEYGLSAILYFAKQFDRFAEQQRRHVWDRRWLSELDGRQLVVLGAGAVAEALALRAENFGLRVTAVGRKAGSRKFLQHVVTTDELQSVLQSTDFLVCCLPLTTETRGLIGEEELRALPRHAVFVNIGRGGIVDERALARALNDGWIRGAALDVFEQEPLPETSPLWQCPSVLITPHVAGTTDRYLGRMLDCFEANWNSLCTTGHLATPVTPGHEL